MLFFPCPVAKQSDDSMAWRVQSVELLAELPVQMATCLGYHDFNKARIKCEAYVPKYLANMDAEQKEPCKTAVEVSKGSRPLTVAIEEEVPRGFQAGAPGIVPRIKP